MKRLFLLLAAAASLCAQATISISSSGAATPYDGLGALDGGAIARFINNYPASQQREIMDYLWCNPAVTPAGGYCTHDVYGAALNIFKFAIGGDGLDGEGAEASHERTNGTINCTVGYEWYYIQQAKARNPNIKLYGLIWSAPGWVDNGGSTLFTTQGEQYIADFANCLINSYGYNLDYVGLWNENPSVVTNGTWIKALFTYLAGHVTVPPVIIAADQGGGAANWGIGTAMQGDATLKADIGIVGEHYITTPTNSCSGTDFTNSVATGKHIWNTEGGPWKVPHSPSTDWTAAGETAQFLMADYQDCGASSTIFWAMLTGYFATLPLPNAGMFEADQPWTGYYLPSPTMWVIAHYTQFAQPGDSYIKPSGGSCTFSGTGSCVIIMAANGVDYHVIANTIGASTSQVLSVTVGGTLSTGVVHPWCSSATQWFVQNAQNTSCPTNQTPSGGTWSITIPANYVVTATTTTGQVKGVTTPPTTGTFPDPYYDYFAEYPAGVTPQYFSTIVGAFEVAPCVTIAQPQCMTQQITSPLLSWTSTYASDEPITIVGNPLSANQTFGVQHAAILGTGSLKLLSRFSGIETTTRYGQPKAYQFYINNSGGWKITVEDTLMVLNSGTATAPGNADHAYQMSVTGCPAGVGTASINVKMDGTTIATATDNNNGGNCYFYEGNMGVGAASTAQSGVVSGSYINVEFQGFWITSQPSITITSPTSGQVFTQPQALPLTLTPTALPTAYRAVWTVDGIGVGQAFSADQHQSPIDPVEAWTGVPFGLQWPVGNQGDGAKTATATVYDIFGNQLAAASQNFTVDLEGMANQSINAMPNLSGSTVSGTGGAGLLTFDGTDAGQPVYIDGIPLPGACGTSGQTSQSGGWFVPSMNTACYPNGTHWALLGYNLSNGGITDFGSSGDPYILTNTLSSVSGTSMAFGAAHYGRTGEPLYFTNSGGALPSPLSAGYACYWKTTSTNPNLCTESISGGLITVTISTNVATSTPVLIRNIQLSDQTTGLPVCDGLYTATNIDSTHFSVPAPAACTSGAGTANLEIIVGPYFGTYIDSTHMSVSATCGSQNQYGLCTPGNAISLTAGSGTTTAHFRIRSPYWVGSGNNGVPIFGGDLAQYGGQAFVAKPFTFANGNAPYTMHPAYWELHLIAGGSTVNLCNAAQLVMNTDNSFTSLACNAAGVSWTPSNDGGVSYTSVATVAVTSSAATVTPVGAGWMQITLACSSCAAGGASPLPVTIYVNVQAGSITYPHFSRSGPILTSFTPGSSFVPMGLWQMNVTYATPFVSAGFRQDWLTTLIHNANINSSYTSWDPGSGPGTVPQSSCPSTGSTTKLGYAESFSMANGMSIEFDQATNWWTNGSGGVDISALAAILSNTQYARQTCITTLTNHQVSTGLYWSYGTDDEFTFDIGTRNEPDPAIGGADWTNAVVSGGTVTLNFSPGISLQTAYVQSTGFGNFFEIVSATNTCLNGWYPMNSLTNIGSPPDATIAISAPSSCSNGTYSPTGGITETTAKIVLNPSPLALTSANNMQNVSALPSALAATQQGWNNTYFGAAIPGTVNATSSALVSIVVNSCVITVNYNSHGIAAGTAVRLWDTTTANLNGLAVVNPSPGMNSFTMTYPNTTGLLCPANGTYNSSTDGALILTVDPNFGPNPLGQYWALINAVTGHPARRNSILGSFFGGGNSTVQSFEGDSTKADASFLYIPAPWTNIYGVDGSVYGAGQYSYSTSGLTSRAFVLPARSMLFASGYVAGNNIQQYCRSYLFNPFCDKPTQLMSRPETMLAQLAGMKVIGIRGYRGYNFSQDMTDIYRLLCCGWQAAGTGTGGGMNPQNDPRQWKTFAQFNAYLALTAHTELQPETNKPFIAPYAPYTDAHLSATYGNSVTVACQSEGQAGSITAPLNAIAGGSLISYTMDGYSLRVQNIAGNPSSVTADPCPTPGAVTTYVSQPPGYNVMDNITFAPPSPLPFSASRFLIQVGYYPDDMRNDPVTDCTSACTIAVDHHIVDAYYRVIYTDTNDLPRSIGQPVRIASQGIY